MKKLFVLSIFVLLGCAVSAQVYVTAPDESNKANPVKYYPRYVAFVPSKMISGIFRFEYSQEINPRLAGIVGFDFTPTISTDRTDFQAKRGGLGGALTLKYYFNNQKLSRAYLAWQSSITRYTYNYALSTFQWIWEEVEIDGLPYYVYREKEIVVDDTQVINKYINSLIFGVEFLPRHTHFLFETYFGVSYHSTQINTENDISYYVPSGYLSPYYEGFNPAIGLKLGYLLD